MTLDKRAEQIAARLVQAKPEDFRAVLETALSSVWAEARQNAVEIISEHYQAGRPFLLGRLRGMEYSEMLDRRGEPRKHVCGLRDFDPEKHACLACKEELDSSLRQSTSRVR